MVFPTYCFLHLEHVTRYMMLLELQVNECLILYLVFVVVLIKKSLGLKCWHVVVL